MNFKENLEKIKKTIKRNAPVIAVAATGVIAVAVVVYIRNKSTSTPNNPLNTYSFGANSILKIQATDNEASAYNRVHKAFIDAQLELRERGSEWDKVSPLRMRTSRKDLSAFNAIARRVNAAINLIDQDETPIEITDDFLVKN